MPDDALKALETAVGLGFADASHTKEDADLESLRGRGDFKDLVARMEKASVGAVQATHGFHSTDVWTGGAEPVANGPADAKDRYWLSILLAYTGEWGNSMPEVESALTASVASDGTDPKGTFYFLANSDVRATTRMPRFQAAVEALKALGKKAEILSKDVPGQTGILPVGKDDVMGGCIGFAGFTWKDSKSRILPGAICEHLTSFGAVFDNGGQTKLTELIRAGAAGASGTVYEPYALPNKFPAPHLQVHYASGCSLAEAFYQSVYGPYQLLMVGDGLARPFARFAKVELSVPARVAGTVKLAPTLTAAPEHPLGRIELFVDGVRVGTGAPDAPLAWDTTTLEDGAHEVRVVAVESGPIETRSDAVATTWVANDKRRGDAGRAGHGALRRGGRALRPGAGLHRRRGARRSARGRDREGHRRRLEGVRRGRSPGAGPHGAPGARDLREGPGPAQRLPRGRREPAADAQGGQGLGRRRGRLRLRGRPQGREAADVRRRGPGRQRAGTRREDDRGEGEGALPLDHARRERSRRPSPGSTR